MNMLFLFLYIFYGLMASTTHGACIDFTKTKPIICTFWGNKLQYERPETPVIDASALPQECEVIFLTHFGMTAESQPAYTEEMLDAVLQLNKTVLLDVDRQDLVAGWSAILTPDGNAKDAKALTDFAISKGVAGVVINSITPGPTEDTVESSIAENIIPYLRQLRINKDFIVGVQISPLRNQLLNSSIIDFEAMNPLVDLYIIDTLKMHRSCQAGLFNGLSPTKSIHGVDGIDTAITQLSKTKIALDKIYLVSTLLVVNPDVTEEYFSHSEACVTKSSTIRWCIPTTTDYYEKGKFFHDQNCGVVITWPELDDVNNSCGCCPFIAVINIAAGYKGEQKIPCAKFDVKDTQY